MYRKVDILNRSLRFQQCNQLRFVAQISAKNADDIPIRDSHSREWVNAKPTSEIPGPTKLQLIRGFMPGGIFYKKSLTDFVNEARKMYGDLVMLPGVFGKDDILLSFNADDFSTVIRSEGRWPKRKGIQTMNYHRNVHRQKDFGDTVGLLGSNDEAWGKIRSAVNPILMQPRNARLYVNKMLEVNDEFLQRIREIRDPHTLEVPNTFLNEINRLTFESVAVVALDQHIGLIRRNRNNEEATALFQSLRTIFNLTLDLDIRPSLWKYVKTPKFNKMMKAHDTMYDIIMKYINQSVDKIESKKLTKNDNEEDSVLEKLLKIDKKIAVVMALDMLMAGVDTTTTTVAGVLLCIAKNPEKQEKLRQEIRSVLPEKDSKLTLDNMKNLPYLRACIKESIRIYPLAAGAPRKCGEDIVMSGYQVPKYHDIFVGGSTLSKEDKYFENAKKFLPERWLRTEENSQPQTNPFVYIPFGMGARSCVGKRLVDMELEITLARLVRNFYLEFNYPTENAFKDELIYTPVIPLKFKFAEVEN